MVALVYYPTETQGGCYLLITLQKLIRLLLPYSLVTLQQLTGLSHAHLFMLAMVHQASLLRCGDAPPTAVAGQARLTSTTPG